MRPFVQARNIALLSFLSFLPFLAPRQPSLRSTLAEYALPIILTFVGFITLAAILLVPVYRFINREERKSREWTDEALANRRLREGPPGDGAAGRPPRESGSDS